MNEVVNSKTSKKNGALIIGVAAAALGGGYMLRGASVGAQGTREAETPVVVTPATRDAVAIQNAFAQVSNAIEPAVVTITTEGKRRSASTPGPRSRPFGGQPFSPFGGGGQGDPFDEFFKQFQQNFGFEPNSLQKDNIRARFREVQSGRGGGGLGSGMIFRNDGLIMTNAHVVAGAESVTVKLNDGREFKKAKVLGIDERTDVAVVKIDAANLPVVKLGDSAAVQVGDWAIAVGNPFGLEHTVTVGVISAKAREVQLSECGGDYLQTDASINPGNSGGPLCDINGRVIGVNNAIYSESGGNIGIGFAIPINTARQIAEQLVLKGKITRGYLGVMIKDLTEEDAVGFGLDASTKGVLVSNVSKNTPGARAGLQEGDIIQQFNGKTVTKSNELQRLVGESPVGSNATLRVLRAGQNITLTARLDELKDEAPKTNPAAPTAPDNDAGATTSTLGVKMRPLTPELAKQFGVENSRGVLIVGVTAGSAAEEAGLQRGDVIERVGQREVTTPQAVTDLVKQILGRQTDENKRVSLFINRKGERSYINVTTR